MSTITRCALITGAAQGLGRAVALRLLERGVDVVGVDVQAEKLEAFGATLGEAAQRFLPIAADLSSGQGAERAVETAYSRFGRLDMLVNAAGGSGHDAVREIDDLSEELWYAIFAGNMHATFHCCRKAVPLMRRNGFGRIVNFSSTLAEGSTAWPTTVGARLAYCSSKGAIEAFSRQLALDLGPAGITVNVVVPGFILTEPGARVHDRFAMLSPADQQRLLGDGVAERRATAVDIADAVAFLVSEEAGHVNGTFVRVGA